MNMHTKLMAVLLASTAMSIALAVPGLAQSPEDAAATSAEDDAGTLDGVDPLAGVWIWVDPTTRVLTSVRPEGVQPPLDPTKVYSQDGSDVVPFELRDGGRGARVGGRFVSTLRIEVAPDGSLRTVCQQDHDHSADPTSDAPAEEAPKS